MLTVICEDNDKMKNKIEKILIREIEVFEEKIGLKFDFKNVCFSEYCNGLENKIYKQIIKIYSVKEKTSKNQ